MSNTKNKDQDNPAQNPSANNQKIEQKRDSKYILSPSQREIFIKNVLPIILVSNIIWLIGDFVFTYIFRRMEFSEFYVIYIIFVVLDIILFVSLNKIALKSMKSLVYILYFIFIFIAGIITIPFVKLGNPLGNLVHMLVFIAIECTIIVCLVGMTLKDKYFAKGHVQIHVILFILFLIIAEIIFLLVFNIKNFLLTIPISLSAICIFSLTTMFFGAKATKKLEKHPIIFIVYKIISVYMLILFISVILAIVILIIIVIVILLDDSDISFPNFPYVSNFYWGTSSRSRTKRKNLKHEVM